jgi:hypothetical protein
MLILSFVPLSAQSQSDQYVRSPRLGITFISSAAEPSDEQRYQNALLLGAAWNRWPMYWSDIERQAGNFNWAAYDQLVSNDLAHDLRIDAILLGISEPHRDGGSIEGLGAPVFSDGSDTMGDGKTPNPGNSWASFVYQAVNRYKPGGLLATQQGWAPGRGVSVWEAWNEPDLTLFWAGGLSNYARLLKVTYLAAHQADSAASVMFGGLAYINPEANDYLAQTLAIYARDHSAAANNWYMDQVAAHNYVNPSRTGWVVNRIKATLANYGLTRPIWLTETGMPVWDDYPGPTWSGPRPADRMYRGTMAQQAAFVIQNTAFAWVDGAEVVFIHQLYDDCDNQPPGTNFMANDGRSTGDAFGLFRNVSSSACYSHHPQPGTPRPAATAYHVLATVFGTEPFTSTGVYRVHNDGTDSGTIIIFDRETTHQRIYVLWDNGTNRVNLHIPATGQDARLYSMDNQDYYITPTDNGYDIGLSAATPEGLYVGTGSVTPVGGAPYILVENNVTAELDDSKFYLTLAESPFEVGAPAFPTVTLAPLLETTPLNPEQITPGPILLTTSVPTIEPTVNTQIIRPTTDPGNDHTPPTTTVVPLPVISPPTFNVAWGGQDDSGIQMYLVWVRINGGDWQPWLQTDQTEGQYSGTSGDTYEFAVWAEDLAGNWSQNTDLTAQAVTHVP